MNVPRRLNAILSVLRHPQTKMPVDEEIEARVTKAERRLAVLSPEAARRAAQIVKEGPVLWIL